MVSLADISTAIEGSSPAQGRRAMAAQLLAAGERSLEAWLEAHAIAPTATEREGFRLLALHHQGAKEDPSFNACRETCRELAFYYNVAVGDYERYDPDKSLAMMRHVARHLYLFVSGKLQENKLGEFCCSSRPTRGRDAALAD